MALEIARRIVNGRWFTGPAESGSDGGGSQPATGSETFSTSVSHEAGSVPFVHVQGDTLLDYSDPLHPTILEAGKYACTMYVTVDPAAVGAGTLIAVDLELDSNSDADPDCQNQAPLSSFAGARNSCAATVVWDCPAGSVLGLYVVHDIGSAVFIAVRGDLQRLT